MFILKVKLKLLALGYEIRVWIKNLVLKFMFGG